MSTMLTVISVSYYYKRVDLVQLNATRFRHDLAKKCSQQPLIHLLPA